MKRFLLYTLFIFMAFKAGAQQPGRVLPLYIAYVQQQLQFTPDEAQRFWPVHAQYQSEVMAVNNSGLNELDKQQRLLDIKRKYQPQFERIIGAERTNRFYPIHDRFVSKLADIQERRQEKKAERMDDGSVIRPNANGNGMRQGFKNGGTRRNREPLN